MNEAFVFTLIKERLIMPHLFPLFLVFISHFLLLQILSKEYNIFTQDNFLIMITITFKWCPQNVIKTYAIIFLYSPED